MKNLNHKAGFTLVETLVAISILVLVVTGAYSAAQTGISSSTLAKEQVVAFYLAQEQIEAIRNIRDENSLNGRYWLTNIDNSANDCQSQGCYVDVACWFWGASGGCSSGASAINPCSSSGCPYLSQNTTNYDYRYVPAGTPGWVQTTYRPKVEITNISGGNNRGQSILVTVEWSKGNITRQFKVRENIFDWQ